MASLGELARTYTDLTPEEIAHLRRLVASWDLLSDISFADMLLFGRVRDEDDQFIILAQIRPTTGPTMYRHDRVGQIVPAHGRPMLTAAFERQDLMDGGLLFRDPPRIRVLDIPIVREGRVLGVVSRQFTPDSQRDPGELEVAYFTVCRRLDRMVADGKFPYVGESDTTDHRPRIGDGVVLVNAQQRIIFLSPNARSVLLRLGVNAAIEGKTFGELGLRTPRMTRALGNVVMGIDEFESGGRTTVVAACLPLVDSGELTGAMVLVRDISELRSQGRLLQSKDATIAEIHHRVKNNLQTISSLLRLQGRRLVGADAKMAIDESVRRIQSIAVVHEILSQESGDAAPFDDIVRPLVRLVEEGLVDPNHPIRFDVEGNAGALSSEQSTHLAVVLTELLQNAVEHAFTDATEVQTQLVTVCMANDGEQVQVSVCDNGIGLGDANTEPDPDLGLTIVHTLVTAELRGTLNYRPTNPGEPHPGTTVAISFPLLT